MGKKAWLIYIAITIIIFVIGAVCMLVLVPPTASYSDLPESYIGINKSEYTFDDSVNNQTLSKEYDITASDVSQGLKQDKYEQGNINPFTPKGEVSIYNEPTLENENKNENGSTLTPDDK